MTYPRAEPPEPKISGIAAEEIRMAYDSATESYAEVEELSKEPGGYDLTAERKAVLEALQAYADAVEEIASDCRVRL